MREDVVHRKLTADGEGVGDERRVMSVVNVGSYNGFFLLGCLDYRLFVLSNKERQLFKML